MTIAHSALTGSALHEPKGVATAVAGTVYAANGSGSGAWTDPNTLITSSVFTTGDVKPTFKNSEVGWLLMTDGSIGSAASGATSRANADTEDLFILLWNNVSDTWAQVSGGRGVSAAADFAANKALSLPKTSGRVFGSKGVAGGSITSRVTGELTGSETQTLTEANLAPHSHTASLTVNTNSNNTGLMVNSITIGIPNGDGNQATTNVNTGAIVGTVPSSGVASGATGFVGSGTSHNNMQPSVFLNWLIKL